MILIIGLISLISFFTGIFIGVSTYSLILDSKIKS